MSSVTVRPSAAVEQYRNHIINIQRVAADLNVDTLLTGSFIRDRDKLRITYQLIDVKTEILLGRGTIDLKYRRAESACSNEDTGCDAASIPGSTACVVGSGWA